MWEIDNNQLYKEFSFKNFREAFKFMEAVAELAEQQQHHPKWQNEWNKVGIWLSTHEAGDTITNKDHHLAETIDAAYNRLIQTKFLAGRTFVCACCEFFFGMLAQLARGRNVSLAVHHLEW